MENIAQESVTRFPTADVKHWKVKDGKNSKLGFENSVAQINLLAR